MKCNYPSVPLNFAAIPDEFSRYETARVALFPIPYEATVSYRPGTCFGPAAIIEASRNMEQFDLELRSEPFRFGIATLPELERASKGPGEMMERIHRSATQILNDGKFLVTLGGEHSITFPLVKAQKERFNDLSVLHLDAHLDLRDEYEGCRESHACVMRRVWELNVRFVSVGIRSASLEECDFAREQKLRFFSADMFLTRDAPMEEIVAALTPNVYVTIDLDAFDPSVVPAVGTPEPGGLSWNSMLSILRAVTRRKRVVGFDVVELSPIPGEVASDFAAARLTYKMIGYCLGA